MNKFWIVLAHTYFTKLKSKSFMITTIITALLVLGLTNLNHIIELFSDEETKTVAVIDKTGELYEPLEEQLKTDGEKDIDLRMFKGAEDKAKEKVQNGEWQAYVVLGYDDKQLPKAAYYAMTVADSDTPLQLEQALQQIKTTLATAKIGLSTEQVKELYEPVVFEKVALEKNAKTEEELNQARLLVYILLFAIYIFVFMYGTMIVMEVATEKSSRIMEILISSASPVQQMFGKIFGVALLSLTQFSILFVIGYTSIKENGELTAILGFEQIPVATIAYAIVFFLLGYFLYATLFALLGSLVSRIEEVQQMITPVNLLVIAAFFIAMFGLNNPEVPFITVTSFIPFFAPMIMFLRVGMLNVPMWEIALSIGLLVATISFFAYFGAKVYRGGVLMYGKSTSFKDIKKALQLTKK
ncbi:ABC-2 type transport system permease protein [Anoxybacillus calidus]|jgi:ABC-2 type transport system permease protein|uniref:ABC-2 type transport system permease protein n=1 Tax=[Anoxybacillus] calidus TaxID=575178 RepID=A0A7V9Z162_9BACL|nr:ABC transporter permease [Anoxybacillus calidus]MBA2872000.1 ABC-2 type transport system permease protein [Anoxybacillus calidus]